MSGTNAEESLTAFEQDLKTQAQLDLIKDEINAAQPLVSTKHPIATLSSTSNFEPSSDFDKGSQYLATKYKSYRAIRRDGNCYYRAFLYALSEKLQMPPNLDELKRVQDYAQKSIDEVTKFGYDRFTIEIFWEEFVDLLSSISEGASTPTTLHEQLNEENSVSDYCTWYLRVITSAYLKKDSERFIHFLDDPNYFDVDTFCSKEVDPMGRECGMVQVLALAEALGVTVYIEYLDGKELQLVDGERKLVKHSFCCNDEDKSKGTEITLLYRPGHYDILY